MKPNIAILLLLLPLTVGLEAKEARRSPSDTGITEQNEANTPASILEAQVKEIASATTMSRKSQAKLITNAIRLAVTTAIEGVKKPVERLEIALELTTAAAKAAPQFAATITSAVSDLPAIARINGALDQIQAAVKAGIEAGEETELANPAVNPPRPDSHEFGGPDKGNPIVSPSH